MLLTNLKICGITSRDTAWLCAKAGVGALGAVFFQKSPRYVTPQLARALFDGLPSHVARVGVFVDMPASEMIAIAHTAALDTIQMHGNESLSTISSVQQAGFHVIKVVKVAGKDMLESADTVPSSCGILIECGHGALPGGNGATWFWAEAAPLVNIRAFAIAGGLTPQNFIEAATLSKATAWDVSSGVESAPGVKDPGTLQTLFTQARKLDLTTASLFWKGRQPKQQLPDQPVSRKGTYESPQT